MRGIFPIINFCTDAGIDRASEGEIERVYRALIESRTRTNGVAS
jgi:hypothetical protein